MATPIKAQNQTVGQSNNSTYKVSELNKQNID